MQTLILDYQNKQLLCIRLTVTCEKVTLTRKKNGIKILAKLYESATSHSSGSIPTHPETVGGT